jgi:hypothetical protein
MTRYLGEYWEVLHDEGEQPFCRVYTARDRRTQIEGRLWVVRPSLTPAPEARGRFVAQAQALVGLGVRQQVRVLEVGHDPFFQDGRSGGGAGAGLGAAFVALAATAGQRLAERIAGGRPATDAVVAHLAASLAEALDEMHARGLVHGYLAASDVIMAGEAARLAGAGLWSALDRGAALAAYRGAVHKLAPEIRAGEAPSARADIYAMAVILAEIALGTSAENAVEAAAVRDRLRQERARLAAALAPAFATAPGERPPSSTALAGELVSLLPRGRARLSGGDTQTVRAEEPQAAALGLMGLGNAVPLDDGGEDDDLPFDGLPASGGARPFDLPPTARRDLVSHTGLTPRPLVVPPPPQGLARSSGSVPSFELGRAEAEAQVARARAERAEAETQVARARAERAEAEAQVGRARAEREAEAQVARVADLGAGPSPAAEPEGIEELDADILEIDTGAETAAVDLDAVDTTAEPIAPAGLRPSPALLPLPPPIEVETAKFNRTEAVALIVDEPPGEARPRARTASPIPALAVLAPRSATNPYGARATPSSHGPVPEPVDPWRVNTALPALVLEPDATVTPARAATAAPVRAARPTRPRPSATTAASRSLRSPRSRPRSALERALAVLFGIAAGLAVVGLVLAIAPSRRAGSSGPAATGASSMTPDAGIVVSRRMTAAADSSAGSAPPPAPPPASAARVPRLAPPPPPAPVPAQPAPPGPIAKFPPTIEALAPCPSGMVRVTAEGRACIDVVELAGPGGSPLVDLDLAGAGAACVAEGKRLCRAEEWEAACRGPRRASYPWGHAPSADVCNLGGGPLRPSQPSGRCVSASGAVDMAGNVAEWVAEGQVRGASAKDGGDGRCSTKARPGAATRRDDLGVRCCHDLL